MDKVQADHSYSCADKLWRRKAVRKYRYDHVKHWDVGVVEAVRLAAEAGELKPVGDHPGCKCSCHLGG